MKQIYSKGALWLVLTGMFLMAGSAYAIHPMNETAAPAAEVPMFAPPAVIDNGLIKLGVRAEGHLNIPGAGIPSRPSSSTTAVGLRLIFPDGSESEATAPGCLCEGWGASAGAVSGYANEDVDGVVNLTPISFVDTPTTAVSVVDVGTVLEVTHDYHPSVSPNLYEVTVTLKNISGADIADLRYRRVMDWDISPTTFDEFVTIDGGTAADLIFSSDNGFASANPLVAAGSILFVGNAVDSGPTDHGAIFDFKFADITAGTPLADGDSKTFTIYYGAAFNEPDALAALAAVGAEAFSFGQPNVTLPADHGEPNTFIFAFGDVGGEPIFEFDVCVSQEQNPGAGDFEFLGIIDEFDRSGESAADVYSYGVPAGSSYNGTPPSISDTSQLFLVNTNDGAGASLFVVHDTPGAGGGNADMTFDVVGDTAAILLEDDPGGGADSYTDAGGTLFTSSHLWVNCCTDGVVIGTLEGGWLVDAEFDSLGGISAWQATSADGSSIPLVPDLDRRVRLSACLFEKELTSGPDRDEDGQIDLAVPINVEVPTEYDFTISYINGDDRPVWIYDTVPAEWDVVQIEDDDTGLPVDCGDETSVDGDHGDVDVWRGGKSGKKCNSDTSLRWMPGEEDDDLKVWTKARCHNNRNNKRCRPTSCGALYLNYGAVAFQKDENGDLVLDDEGNPIVVAGPTNGICLAAVDDIDGDGTFTWDGSGDEDGDTLLDYAEACELGTDPCLADSDGDGVNDNVDACPLEGPPNADEGDAGEVQDPNGCNRQSQCSDSIDNDDDGPIDYPDDLSCDSIEDDTEDSADV